MAIAAGGCKIMGWHNFLVQKLEAKIVSLVCNVMRTASLRPITILPHICTVWCTKLQKHSNTVMEVLYCFTVSIGLPGDALHQWFLTGGTRTPWGCEALR